MRAGRCKQYLFLFIFLSFFSFSLSAQEVTSLNRNLSGENQTEKIKKDKGCMVTNLFIEIDLRQALNEISTQCNVPILIDDMVHGFVSLLEADEMPIEECLEMILKPGGFFFKKIDDYYIVTSPDSRSPLFSQTASIVRIRPRHLKAEDIPPLIPSIFSDYIKIDDITNSLIITAYPETIKRIKEYLTKIDLPPPQVMIEALITEISSTGSKKLGIDWYVEWNENKMPLSDSFGSVEFKNLSATINYLNPGKTLQNVVTTLKLLIEQGEASIKANPKITAINGETAYIHIGKEQYYILQAPAGATYTYSRFESIETGITLKITPYVYDSGEITVTIEPEVSDVLSEGIEESPIISRRKAKTTVTVKDGQPIVIGGLQLSSELKTKSGYPCIGDIPILGLLFQTRKKAHVQNEVVIIITPHLFSIDVEETS